MSISTTAAQSKSFPGNAIDPKQQDEKKKIGSIPEDLFQQHICPYLTTRDLLRCNLICRTMRTYVSNYTNHYTNIWAPTLLHITTSKSAVGTRELGQAIINKSISNHTRIARIVAGMPKEVKQEIADRISQEEPVSTQKAKALTLLEAPAAQIAAALSTNSTYTQAAAVAMIYTNRSITDLLTIAKTEDFWSTHDSVLNYGIEAMVIKGAEQEKLVAVLKARQNQRTTDLPSETIAREMVASRTEPPLATVKKIPPNQRNEAVHRIILAMLAKDVINEEELMAVLNEIEDKGWRSLALRDITIKLAARKAVPEELLDFMKMQGEFAFCDLIKNVAGRGAGQEELLAITERAQSAGYRDAFLIGSALAMTMRGVGQKEMLAFIREKTVSQESRDSILRYVAEAMAMLGAEQETLLAITEEIQCPFKHGCALHAISNVMAARGAGQEALLAIIKRIDPNMTMGESSGALRDAIQAIVTRKGSRQEDLLSLIEQLQKQNPICCESTLRKAANAMAARGVAQEELLSLLTI
ncbi:MAG: F-box protein [Verrucomicrobiota bacterium]|nr:F-box protein [Verrucomicrobiota bacterium]